MNHSIILIGFMGSGKTAIGKILSDKRAMDLVDTDSWIERHQGRTVSQIFAAEGERFFRQMETECLETLLTDKRGKVIATGGGLPVKIENRPLLKQLGTVVYLRVSVGEVMRRLRGDDTRPLLQGGDPLNRIKQLLELRTPIYEQTADVAIDTVGKDKEAISDAVILAVNEHVQRLRRI